MEGFRVTYLPGSFLLYKFYCVFERSSAKSKLDIYRLIGWLIYCSPIHEIDNANSTSYVIRSVNAQGQISLEELEANLSEDTSLVSIMTVNNEIGVLQPVEEIGRMCRYVLHAFFLSI